MSEKYMNMKPIAELYQKINDARKVIQDCYKEIKKTEEYKIIYEKTMERELHNARIDLNDPNLQPNEIEKEVKRIVWDIIDSEILLSSKIKKAYFDSFDQALYYK